MLGLGRASQYAGWWSSAGPAEVTMNSVSTLSYEDYQTPVYTWLNIGVNTTGYLAGAEVEFAAGNIAAGNVTAAATYNNNSWTYVWTFALDYASGLTYNQGYKTDTRFRGNSGDGDFTTNMAWVADATGTNLDINWPTVLPGFQTTMSLSGLNNRWLTLVSSCSNTSASYTDWSGIGSGAYYARNALYDSFNGQLILKYDGVSSSRPMGYPTDFGTWISNCGNTISTTRSDAYSYRIGSAGPSANCNLRIGGQWVTFGTMFDPETVKTTDTTWLTTRPNQTIGNATAWINNQFATTGNTAGYDTAWGTVSSSDRFTPQAADNQIKLIDNSGNSTVFNARYSTSSVPTTGNFT